MMNPDFTPAITHTEMVEALCKDPEDIIQEMTADKAHLLHMILGAAGEVGELVDAVKKFCIYGKDLDVENVIEELGDLEFYLEGFRQRLKLSRGEILAGNVNKLGKRYKDFQYTNQRAIERADKQ